jgi:hypothetical protein
MNQNQEFAVLLMRLMEIAASTIASCVRVLRGGMDVAIETSPDKPRLTNGHLLMSDIGLLNAAIIAVIDHLKTRRQKN